MIHVLGFCDNRFPSVLSSPSRTRALTPSLERNDLQPLMLWAVENDWSKFSAAQRVIHFTPFAVCPSTTYRCRAGMVLLACNGLAIASGLANHVVHGAQLHP